MECLAPNADEPQRDGANTEVWSAPVVQQPENPNDALLPQGDVMQSPVANSPGASCAIQSPVWEFLRFASQELPDDCLFLSFSPLPANLFNEFQSRVLAPSAGSNDLDIQGVGHILERNQVMVGACIVDDAQEMEVAGMMLREIRNFTHITVFVALILPSGLDLCDLSDTIAIQQDSLVGMGVHEIILNPPLLPGALLRKVKLGRIVHNQHAQRFTQHQEIHLPRKFSARKLQDLAEREQTLLWDVIPRNFHNSMPYFPILRRNIPEDGRGPLGRSLGEYTFELKYPCDVGQVFLATDLREVPVVVKVVVKSEIHTPDEVEAINRELTFLHSMMHPNIARCINSLHTANNLYMILEHSGDENLEQYCRAQAGGHLDEGEAVNAFKQVVSALAWMHEKNVSHRSVSLHHVVVKREASLHCTLIDLRHAIVAQGDTVSSTPCGCLPCMAPEVALAEAYVPRFADKWSAGILLLEISGGLGTLLTSAYPDLDAKDDVMDCVEAVYEFFQDPDCCEQALGIMDGVSSPRILRCLQELLELEPESRISMADLSEILSKNP